MQKYCVLKLMQYICKVNKAQQLKKRNMKATIKEQLDNANEGLCNAHYYLAEAIKNNDTREEDYWFKSVWRFAELIDKLENK